MKEIPLTQGMVAYVDDEVFWRISPHRWQAAKHRNTFYAVRSICIDGRRTTIRMHREIMMSFPGEMIDHVNRNGLDNRVQNLRVATAQQNAFNRKGQKNNVSGYKGVSFHEKSQKYYARITISGITKTLGYFDTPEEASKVYNQAANEYFGRFQPNIP